MKAIASLFAPFLVAASADAEGTKDYRARTVYFVLTDRFNSQTPYNPYVDPEYPDAANSVDSFVEVPSATQPQGESIGRRFSRPPL